MESDPQYRGMVWIAIVLIETWVLGGMVCSFPWIVRFWEAPFVYLGWKALGRTNAEFRTSAPGSA